jgi:hypothetical protein
MKNLKKYDPIIMQKNALRRAAFIPNIIKIYDDQYIFIHYRYLLRIKDEEESQITSVERNAQKISY